MRRGRADLHMLAGAYALDAVPPPDRSRFERHLARCPCCAQETAELTELTARLACAAATPPPAGLIDRTVALAGRTRQLPPTGVARRTRSGPRLVPQRLATGLAVVLLAASVALGLVARHVQRQASAAGQRSQQVAAVLTAPDAVMLTARVTTGGTATVVMSHRDAALVFTTSGLRRLPSGRCYQLWLMGPAGDRSAGMLPVPRDGMSGPLVVSGLRAGDRVGLTVEPEGGMPRPTSVPILMVTL